MSRVVGIIPARYGSTRLPAKALAVLKGRPLIQHVWEQAKQARHVEEVLVATDDARIVQAVEAVGGKAVMTSPAHRSGTDRIAEVARQMDAQAFLNIQGDEPLVRPEQIDQVAQFLLAHRAVPMVTLMTPLTRREDQANPNVVKVVVDQDGYALYFSRAPIPFVRDGARGTGHGARESKNSTSPAPRLPPPAPFFKHLGIYGYQRDFLLRFPTLPPTPLEQAEQLEQLRAVEHGYRIKVLETPYDTVGVDTPEDLKRVEQLLKGQGAGGKGRGQNNSPAPRLPPPAPTH